MSEFERGYREGRSRTGKDAGRLLALTKSLVAENASLKAQRDALLEALTEALKDLRIYQMNARSAARTDDRWEGVAEAIQPRIDGGEAAIAKVRGDKYG